MKTVIVYGPPRSGKTTRKQELADKFGCSTIIDGWSKRDDIIPGALHLTNDRPKRPIKGVKIIAISEVGV